RGGSTDIKPTVSPPTSRTNAATASLGTIIPDAWACNPNTMVRAAGTTCRRYDSTVTLSIAPGASRVETRPSPSVHGGRWWSGFQKCVCTSVITNGEYDYHTSWSRAGGGE